MNEVVTYFWIDNSWTDKDRFKELRRKLRRFHKKNIDITAIQDNIYWEVEALLFDSNFKYIQIIHYLIFLGVPLQEKLIKALLDRTYSEPRFQNQAEEDAYRICREFFPEAASNVHLWWLWCIEMDILLPHRRVNIEIDKTSSPKRKITTERRREFLEKNFGIRVYRYTYSWDVLTPWIESLCEQIYQDVWRILID